MGNKLQSLPGFRDFYPDDCAVRNYVFDHWRAVAHRYGFHEYEAPLLESAELYKKKSGAEILDQLFHFEDRGEREVALRPELTPSLARMATARQRDFKKPMRWFGIGQFFRYEKPQKGRTREFYQFNVDILGELSKEADAELIALAIDLMRDLGFTAEHFAIRISDRDVWLDFMEAEGMDSADPTPFLQVIDKMEREKTEVTDKKLEELGTSCAAVDAFISDGANHARFSPILKNLAARGMGEFVTVDLGIVRGLAYYTGSVFEVFDKAGGMRAIAGGGRYDKLCGLIGGTDMAACGFAMGDVVITDLIRETKTAHARLLTHLGRADAADVFVIIADEKHRAEAVGAVQRLRQAGHRVDYALAPAKVGKQFSQAEYLKARAAVIIGSEFPEVGIKDLFKRSEQRADIAAMPGLVQQILDSPLQGPLIA